MSSLIIRDIKYHILKSLTLVIIRIVEHAIFFLTYFLRFVTFCGNAPPHGDLEKF